MRKVPSELGRWVFLGTERPARERHLSVAGAPVKREFVIVFSPFLDACVRRRPAVGVKVERPVGTNGLDAGEERRMVVAGEDHPGRSASAPAYLGPRTFVGSAT